MKDFIKKLEDKGFKYKSYQNDDIVIINGDCLKVMGLMEDDSVDLVLTDPPYGIDIATGKIGADGLAKTKDYGVKEWDKHIPSVDIFKKILSIGKNQIIFGGNYFAHLLPPSKRWIVWDKEVPAGMTFSGVELAWTSIKKNSLDFIRYQWHGMLQKDMKHKEERVHPTQKPTGLFKKIIEDYSKDKELIFDGFLGSGTTALACLKTNRRCIGVELDEDYFKICCDRIEKQLQSPTLFGGF
jgi:DNA modification methylase